MTTDLYLLKTRHHFWEDSVHGWHEAGEDEDGGKVSLLLPKPAATSLICLRRLIRLGSLDQLRTHCRLWIPGRTCSTAATSLHGSTHGRQGPGVTRLLRVANSVL